jgi:hypothetical protein
MTTQVFVYSMTQLGGIGAWSRYIYPWDIEDQAQLNNDLYLRSGDAIYRVDKSRLTDDILVDDDVVESPVDMVIRWPYLDFGAPGVTKMLAGFDVVGNGECEVRIGWNQRDYAMLTPAYTMTADTVTGGIIPIPLSSPSFSMELTFRSDDNDIDCEWLASNLYLQDFRMTS